MEVKTLKDLKIALSKVPEDELDMFGFNFNDEGEEVSLLCFDADSDPVEKWNEVSEKYPEILDIDKWVKAIIKVGIKAYEQEVEDEAIEDMISSKDYKD